jgi:hypothetical protein
MRGIQRGSVDMTGRNGVQAFSVTQGVLAPKIRQDVPAAERVVRVDPQGESILRWKNEHDLTVTGISTDPPKTSHLSFTGVVSLVTLEREAPEAFEQWMSFNLHTYVLRREGASHTTVQAGVAGLMERYAKAEMEEDGIQVAYRLEPLTDVRLRSTYGGTGATGQFDLMVLFAGIGLFVLVVAGVHFVNLSTARARRRPVRPRPRRRRRPGLARRLPGPDDGAAVGVDGEIVDLQLPIGD